MNEVDEGAGHRLDEKGRCCGRKPLVYKTGNLTPDGPHKYCPRCDRAYNLQTGEWQANWAWQSPTAKQIPKKILLGPTKTTDADQ